MFVPYLLSFCRIVIGLVFAWSFLGKVQDISSFIQTIDQFNLLPKGLHRPVAIVFLGCELIILGMMILGGQFLVFGFLLAALVLIMFSTALISTLTRNIRISCNCFGSSQKSISSYDVIRNSILILLSLGAYSLIRTSENVITLSWLEWGLMSFAAVIFVVILIEMRDVIQMFR